MISKVPGNGPSLPSRIESEAAAQPAAPAVAPATNTVQTSQPVRDVFARAQASVPARTQASAAPNGAAVVARSLGFQTTDARTPPTDKDGPIFPDLPDRPHGPLHGPIMHYEWWVTDQLGRGNQPTSADLQRLKDAGFKSIINLRTEDDTEAPTEQNLGLNELHVDWVDKTPPTQAQIHDILDFMTKPENQPAYIHCLAGQNRTSVAVACYRMAVEGWPLSKAMDEAKSFGMHTQSQLDFVTQYASDLQAGNIQGYPLVAMQPEPTPDPTPNPNPNPNPTPGPTPTPTPTPHVPIPPLDPEQVRLFTMPEASAWPLEDAINRATKSVDVSAYMLTSSFITNALKAAAARGVTVRVMLEGTPVGGDPANVQKQIADLQAAGIQAEVTPPSFDQRGDVDHAKFMVIDGNDALIGTGNLVKSSLGGSSVEKDRDFWIEDTRAESASEAEALFNADWNRQPTTGIDFKNLVVSPVNSNDKLLGLINNAQKRLVVYNQEFSDPDVVNALIAAKQRGVDVQVLAADQKGVGGADKNGPAVAQLAAAGITAKEMTSDYLHAKAIVADDQAFIGSQNFSKPGMLFNRELGDLTSDPTVVNQLLAQFQADLAAN